MNRKKMILLVAVLAVSLAGSSWGAKFRPFGTQARVRFDATHFVEITHADLTTATTNTAQTLTTMNVLSNQGVQLVAMELIVAFSDDATNGHNTLSVTVGDGTDTDLYLQSTEINGNGSTVWIKYGRSVNDTGNYIAYVTNVADTAAASVAALAFAEVPLTNYVPLFISLTNIIDNVTNVYQMATGATAIAFADVVTNLVATSSNVLTSTTATTADGRLGTSTYGTKVYTADDTIDFVFTGDVEYAVSALDNGVVRFYFRVLDATKPIIN